MFSTQNRALNWQIGYKRRLISANVQTQAALADLVVDSLISGARLGGFDNSTSGFVVGGAVIISKGIRGGIPVAETGAAQALLNRESKEATNW